MYQVKNQSHIICKPDCLAPAFFWVADREDIIYVWTKLSYPTVQIARVHRYHTDIVKAHIALSKPQLTIPK